MAITKEVKYDKIEIVGEWKAVHCRELTVVKEDDVEISRGFHRHVLHPDSDISGEPQEVQDICNLVWTSAVSASWAAHQTRTV
tara:strand:- start:47 stop:295 length:249 start_codon:yes stop_codon:yes gene_type:complete